MCYGDKGEYAHHGDSRSWVTSPLGVLLSSVNKRRDLPGECFSQEQRIGLSSLGVYTRSRALRPGSVSRVAAHLTLSWEVLVY